MLRPIKTNVIVQIIEKEKITSGGIILRTADPEEVSKGLVLKVGPDVTEVVEGDIILPNWNAARETKYEDETYYIIDQDEIVGVFDQ